MEEIFWKQRGNNNWILKGDSNTKYFQLIANGRRRKSYIKSLVDGDRSITEQGELEKHIVRYYKDLFGASRNMGVYLGDNFWESDRKIPDDIGNSLIVPFIESEVKKVIEEMKSDSAPRPNGFGAHFFKVCWEIIKGNLMEMFKDWFNGNLDLQRLNYGVITLVPKTMEANCIKQYRPICLVYVEYKIFTKTLNSRIAEVAK